jgi:hypothetical protein
MDRWEAQYNFWSQFGVPAYEANSVPDLRDVTFPYITYEAAASGFDEPVYITASVWDNTSSWSRIDPIVDEIERYIRKMGCPKMDGGRYRVYVGDTTFAQNMGDPDNDKIRRKVLNVTFEFMMEV